MTGVEAGRARGAPAAWAVALALVAALSAWYGEAARRYPYYVLWDMDLVAALDVLAIGSGELPDHVAHPGFGAYWLWSWTARAAATRGDLGAADYEALEQALDPILVAAELTDFLRAHSPWAALAIPLLLALAVGQTCRAPPGLWVVALATLAAQESLLYHASLVRSGTYAVAFWAGGVWLLSLAAARPHARQGLSLGAGVLLGLALQTKLQAVGLLLAAPLWWALALRGAPDGRWGRPPAQLRTAQVLAALQLLALGGLLLAAHAFRMPPGLATWAEDYPLGPVGWGALLASGLQLALALWASRRPDHPLGWVAARWTWVGAGLCLSFLLHFGVYEAAGRGWDYLLVDAKQLFFRSEEALGVVSLRQRLEWAALALGYAPVTYGVHALLWIAALSGRALGWVRLSRAEVLLWLGLSAVAALLLLGTRFNLRDLLWEETLLNLVSVTVASTLARRARPPEGRALALLAGLALAALLLSGWQRARGVEARLAANYNLYGWRAGMWERGVFKRSHPRYTQTVDARAGSSRHPALTRAVRWRSWLAQARAVLPNQAHTTADLGLLREGWPVWRDSPRRLRAVPTPLRDALSVDCATRPLDASGLLIPRTVRDFNERRDKRALRPRPGRLGVLARSDLRVLVFVHPDERDRLRAGLESELLPVAGELQIAPADEDDGRRVALELRGYAELQLDRCGARPLVVIAPR